MKYQTTRKLWMLLLTAALLALLFLPAALAEETLPSVHVTLGDGEPIGYFDGFEGNFLKSADSVKGVTGRLSLSYEVESYITKNGQRKMRVDLENVTLTDDVMVLYYRLSQDESIQYEADWISSARGDCLSRCSNNAPPGAGAYRTFFIRKGTPLTTKVCTVFTPFRWRNPFRTAKN